MKNIVPTQMKLSVDCAVVDSYVGECTLVTGCFDTCKWPLCSHCGGVTV